MRTKHGSTSTKLANETSVGQVKADEAPVSSSSFFRLDDAPALVELYDQLADRNEDFEIAKTALLAAQQGYQLRARLALRRLGLRVADGYTIEVKDGRAEVVPPKKD